MRRWQVFSALCGHLRSGLLGGHRDIFRLGSWEELIEAARAHVVIPSLGWCVREDKSLSPPLHSYLDAALRLNGKRNERLCNQLEQAAGALNAVDIEPVLLKGAAYLLGDLYPSSAARLMGDLDLLVPQERAQDAFAAMQRIGFVVDTPVSDIHHHLPQMRHAETNIVIELHTRLDHAESDPIVSASWVHEQSRPMPFRGCRVKMPTPTMLIGHNVVHDQLNHERYSSKEVELRQLLDFAVLRARHGPDIDWEELDRRFCRIGLGQVLATYLRYDEVLFHQPIPAIGSAARPRAMRGLRQSIELPPAERRLRQAQRRARRAWWLQRFMTIVTLPKYYINERRRDPRGLIRVLNPLTWVRRLRAIVRDLK